MAAQHVLRLLPLGLHMSELRVDVRGRVFDCAIQDTVETPLGHGRIGQVGQVDSSGRWGIDS